MRYAFYAIAGLMLSAAVAVAGGASAQAAGVGGSSVGLTDHTLVLKVHDGEHHDTQKPPKRHHKATYKKRHRGHTCSHKRPKTCPHGH